MTRPTVLHDGFLVPNAAGVSHPRMAEPDQIDFSTAANAQWGVVEGCEVTISGTTASTLGGIAIINGSLINVRAASVQIGLGGSQDRFDLIVATLSGDVKVIVGTPGVDPVFPDTPLDNTLLASVFCPTGAGSYDDNVVDKRRFVTKALLTKLATDGELIRNVNGSGNYYLVRGDGRTEWAGDTAIYRNGARSLRIEDHLQIAGNFLAGGNLEAGAIVARDLVTGPNLGMGSAPPATDAVPLGSLFQSVTGRLYLNTSTGWKELMTAEGAIPVGTVLQSIEPPSVMTPKGWVPLDGRVIQESAYPALFTLASLQGYITGIAPNRSMTLPNATGRVLMSATSNVTAVGGNKTINLTTAQMPRHKHNARVNPGGGYTPQGTLSRNGGHKHAVWGGAHTHPVSDPGHAHNDGEYPAGAFVCLVWGGQNKIDALFNDRNHTYSVEAVHWTRPAMTNITISSAGSEHAHDMDVQGDHDHVLRMEPVPQHPHTTTEDEVGANAAIDITPPFMNVYTYVRS